MYSAVIRGTFPSFKINVYVIRGPFPIFGIHLAVLRSLFSIFLFTSQHNEVLSRSIEFTVLYTKLNTTGFMGFILWSMFVRTAERLLQTVQETYRNSGNNQLFLNEEYFAEIIAGIHSRRGVFRFFKIQSNIGIPLILR